MKENERSFKHSIFDHRKKINSLKPTIAVATNIEHFMAGLSLDEVFTANLAIYRLLGKSSKYYPTVIYIPGNAFVAKESAFTHMICSHLANSSHCQVIALDHRLAPEYSFPVGICDVCTSVNLLLSQSKQFKIDHNQLVVMGYSSGANFAVSVTKFAIENNFNITKQILISPILDLSRSLTSHRKYEKQDKTITNNFVNWFLKLYIPNGIDLKTQLLSPFWLEASQLSILPSTDLIFAEFERFRSDSENYYKKLFHAKVDVHKYMVPSQDHSYFWYDLNVIKTVGQQIKINFNLS